MQGRVDKHELAQRIATRLGYDEATVEEFIDAFSEEVYQALKQGDKVSLQNFGTFYVRPEKDSWVLNSIPPSVGVPSLVGLRPTKEIREVLGNITASVSCAD